MDPAFPYCEKFGFDSFKIKRRLAFLYLSDNDIPLIQRLHEEVIDPNLDPIINRFYEILLYHADSRRMLSTGQIIERLKTSQRDYLLSLGIGFQTRAYFEERLRIGIIHAWVGLPLSVYQGAYRALTQLMLDLLPATAALSAAEQMDMTRLLLKLTTLDMSLAIDTYHSSQLANLEEEVSRMHAQEDHLIHKARTDSLTGLMNHENVFRYLGQSITIAHRALQPLCVIMADLDHFKRVNDNYGHRVGDAVLREVAARIMASVRGPDAVGRYGGEEFMVILADADLDMARTIAERIRRHVESTPVSVQDQQISITISLGISSLHDEDTVDSIVNRADEALYNAKAAGRNCVQIAD